MTDSYVITEVDYQALIVAKVEGRTLETTTNTRLIPKRVLFTRTLLVMGTPYPISEQHAEELGLWACVTPNNVTVNSNDRAHALCAEMPSGRLICIDLDAPEPVQRPKHGTPLVADRKTWESANR